MKAKFTISIMLLLTFLLAQPQVSGFTQASNTDLANQVDSYIADTMQRLPIPGLSLAIVKNDQVVYMQGYGNANAHHDPVTPQTIFMLESVSKTFTALAIRQLASAGKISLDEPLQKYIPEFHLADEQAAHSITIQQLLDHTSGISTREGTAPYLISPNTSLAEALAHLAHFKPQYQPGEHVEYSNWNYVLLGEVVTRASGVPYTEYVKANILDPLGMTRTSFSDIRNLPGAAQGNLITFGFSVPYDEQYLPLTLAAGGMTSTAEDMAHYLIAYLNQGQYLGTDLLPEQGMGWYGAYWNWRAGAPPNYVNDSFSGAHNAVNANISLFTRNHIAVVVLMNTLLNEFLPGPSAYDIAMGLVNIAAGLPNQPITSMPFYAAWIIADSLLAGSIFSILWQAFRVKSWRKAYLASSRMQRVLAWFGIGLDLLVSILIGVIPYLAGSRWDIMISHRPDFALPFLAISIAFAVLGLVKIVLSRQKNPILQVNDIN
jgi:CubicO group peptidase (beta-lactamase class C family)